MQIIKKFCIQRKFQIFINYNNIYIFPNLILELFKILQPKYELPKYPVTQISSSGAEFKASVTSLDFSKTYVIEGGPKKTLREYKNGKFHGKGTFIWKDGYYYEGEFRDGTPNGQGTETLPNGHLTEKIR